jgi:hypothetical protein
VGNRKIKVKGLKAIPPILIFLSNFATGMHPRGKI